MADADVSLRAKGAGTAAHVAAARDNEACLQVLLEHGASRRIATGLPLDAMRVDALDRDGRSVYELAVQSGSDKCVRGRGWRRARTLTGPNPDRNPVPNTDPLP